MIETLVVVIMIGIIAAIAIPYLLGTRRAANEASALQSLRTISSAENLYIKREGQVGDPAELATAKLVDSELAKAVLYSTDQGYGDANPFDDENEPGGGGFGLGGGGGVITVAPPENSKSGYSFAVRSDQQYNLGDLSTTTGKNFAVSAIPSIASGKAQTGTRRFCITNNGVVRVSTKNLDRHIEKYSDCNASFGEILR